MMQLQKTIQHVFLQLTESLNMLSDRQYLDRSKTLSNATIGQHTRHIIEMFICLEDGYEEAIVNYEKRKRDIRIETDKAFATGLLKQVYNGLYKPNKFMVLEAIYDEDSAEVIKFDTNYHREIAYNLEHTIHHMALIKIGILELSDLQLPEGFGVASSTMKYKKECAQ
ncbi:MAG: hypothetical protein WKF97_12260 [Chitinophagaceae bacterium]